MAMVGADMKSSSSTGANDAGGGGDDGGLDGCDALTLYGMVLPPYWWVALSLVLLTLFNALLAVVTPHLEPKVKRCCVAHCGCCFEYCKAGAAPTKTTDDDGAAAAAAADADDASAYRRHDADGAESGGGALQAVAVADAPAASDAAAVTAAKAKAAAAAAEAAKRAERLETEKNIALWFLDANPAFAVAQCVLTLAHVIYIAASLTSGASGWHKYSEYVVRIVNSGLLALLVQLWMLVVDRRGAASRVVDIRDVAIAGAFGVGAFPMLPVVVTHLLPALAAYCWVILIPAVLFYGFVVMRADCERRAHYDSADDATFRFYVCRAFTTLLLFRVLLNVFVVVAVQSYVNWAVLLYGGESYIGVFAREYELRSTTCYVSGLSAAAKQMLSFISWF